MFAKETRPVRGFHETTSTPTHYHCHRLAATLVDVEIWTRVAGMAQLKYLIAVDTSEEAEEVMAAAKRLATATDAELSCVTVLRPLASGFTMGGMGMPPYSEEVAALELNVTNDVRTQLENLAAEFGIQAEDVHVLQGNPATEIRALADKENVDLIVIGTHGRHGLGLVLGSTANSLLHGVNCDVLVIRIHPVAD